MPCPSDLPRGACSVGEEARQTRVSVQSFSQPRSFTLLYPVGGLTLVRFMFDRIMPLSDAVEGYALFDQMQVQKVIFTP